MPWKERSIVEERMRFVLRLKDGESMSSLCREFGISRVTGYKVYERYKECGLEGLTDRARTPYRYANKLPAQLEAMIVTLRREKPTWGARKLRERLLRKLPNDVRVPACSTIHAIMDRHGLVTPQRRSRTKTEGTPLSQGSAPNALWSTDYKGEFMLGDKRYCYPLTVSDHASRYLLLCEAMESIKEQGAFTAFERLFKERGLPQAIRSDNGVPFASPNGLFNLISRLIAIVVRYLIRQFIDKISERVLCRNRPQFLVFGVKANHSIRDLHNPTWSNWWSTEVARYIPKEATF